MTFCKPLASEQIGEDTITAYELWEKNASVPHYEIVVSVDGWAREVFPTARTTWKKLYKEICKGYED